MKERLNAKFKGKECRGSEEATKRRDLLDYLSRNGDQE